MTRHLFRACVWRKPDSVEFFEKRRRFEIDPGRTPWKPRPEYVALLKQQSRLAAGVATPTDDEPTTATTTGSLEDTLDELRRR